MTAAYCTRPDTEEPMPPEDDQDFGPEDYADPDPDYQPEPPDETESAKPTMAADLTSAVIDMVRRRAEKEDKPVPVPFAAYTDCLRGGGLWPGLETIVGLTGSHKSQLAAQKVRHAGKVGIPSLIVSAELSDISYTNRLLADEAGVSWSKCETGEATPEDIERLIAAKPSLDALGIQVERVAPLKATPSTVDALCTDFRRRNPDGPAYVVVDFAQLFAADKAQPDARERVGSVMYSLQDIAVRHRLVMTVLSSTARGNYASLADVAPQAKLGIRDGRLVVGNPIAVLAAAKESGEAEYASEGVLVLGRWPTPLDNGDTLIVGVHGKYRFRECRWFALAGRHGRLYEYRVRDMSDLPEVNRASGGKAPVEADEYERRVLDYVHQHPGEVRSVTGFRGLGLGTKDRVDRAARNLVTDGRIVLDGSGFVPGARGQEATNNA